MKNLGQFWGYLDEKNVFNSQSKRSGKIGRDLNERLQMLSNFDEVSTNCDNETFDMFQFYNRTGHDLANLVVQCKYRGEPCDLAWISVIFTRYGKCYTFNNGKNESNLLRTLKGGTDNGLEILLDTEQDDYMPVWTESDEITVEAGFKVQIHSQKEPPFIHELGFGISPGFQYLVATQEQRITFLSQPFGNCSNEFDKSFHSFYDSYSISACRITCETKFVVKECGCRMVHMPGNAPYCSPALYKKCADVKLDWLMEMDENLCVCQTPCEVIRYNLQMSNLRLPSTQALSYLAYKYKKSEQYIRRNFVKLNVFFEALNYETIDQKKAYELPGLLGDIGGQMGLFIGASVLTMLELIDYFVDYLSNKFCRKKTKKSQKRRSNKNDEIEMNAIYRSPHKNKPEENEKYNQLLEKLNEKSSRVYDDQKRFMKDHEISLSSCPHENFTNPSHELKFSDNQRLRRFHSHSPLPQCPQIEGARRNVTNSNLPSESKALSHRNNCKDKISPILRPTSNDNGVKFPESYLLFPEAGFRLNGERLQSSPVTVFVSPTSAETLIKETEIQ